MSGFDRKDQWGFTHKIGYARATMDDCNGNELATMKCSICGELKANLISHSAFGWVCLNHCKEDE